jgi:hypothetical protein
MSESNFESTENNWSLIQKILYHPVFRVFSVLILAFCLFPDGVFSFFDETFGVIALVGLIILYFLNPRPRTTPQDESENETAKNCSLCNGTDIINGICQGCGTIVD